jgi:hypothetical protein
MMLSSAGKSFILAAAALLLLSAGVRADQTPAASSDNDTGTFYTPLSKSVQEDLGDIRPAESVPLASHFHYQASVSGQYTSNARLYHSKDDADFLISPTLQATYDTPLNKYFSLDVEARIEDFTYTASNNQSLGFWGFSGNANVEYRYKPSWPRVYIGVEPYYYFSYDTGAKLTSAIGPVAGIDQSLSINRGKTLLFAGYHFGEYFSNPNVDTRQSHTFTLSLTQQLQRNLYAQIYYQLQYSWYSAFGRDETRDLVGVSFIHQLNPQTFVSLFANYIDNASNNSLAKYTTFNSGLSFVWQY